MINWILAHLVQVGTVVFVIYSIFKSLKKPDANTGRQPPARGGETEDEAQRRVREIQERIRRKIAERQGAPTMRTETPPPLVEAPPAPRSFGETLKRTMQELEQKLQTPPEPVLVSHADRDEIERQARLGEELREAEEARQDRARRVAHHAAEQLEAEQRQVALMASRQKLLTDLRTPENLRRAIVLREVLGPPVALR